MTTVLMVIAPEGFRDEEYVEPRDVLRERGARVVTASVAPGPCRGKLGLMARAEVALFEADPSDYDAVVFVGGGGSEVFFDDLDARSLARRMYEDGKPVAAICIAPTVLANAGLLEGRPATCFSSARDALVSAGAEVTDAPVEQDGTIITASGPEAATGFGERLAEALGLDDEEGTDA